MQPEKKIKIVYINGRPSGHPIHDGYARLLHADFCFVDHKIRWHDVPNVSKLKRFLSWIVCAFTFPGRKKYDIFFTEGVREPVLFMKWFFLLRRRQKIVALMANETFYFLQTNRYGFLARFIMLSFLKKCDAVICIGEYQKKLALPYVDNKKIFTVFNGIPLPKLKQLQEITPVLSSFKILVIANAISEWRIYYKGIDLALSVFKKIFTEDKRYELHIAGEYDEKVIRPYLDEMNNEVSAHVFLHGKKEIHSFLSDSCFLLQLGRGDSFPTTTIECGAAGVPVFVSEETGTKEIIRKIDPLFIVPLEVNQILLTVKQYISLPLHQKMILSEKFKDIMRSYTSDRADNYFVDTFDQIKTGLLN